MSQTAGDDGGARHADALIARMKGLSALHERIVTRPRA